MINRLKELVDKYNEIEKDIKKEIEHLPRHGNTCNCDRPEVFKQIFSGHFDEIIEICLRCGGNIEK